MRLPATLLAALLLPSGFAQAQAPAVPPAPAQQAAPAGDPVLARVDGREIRRSELEEAARALPEELRAMPPQMLYPLLLDQLITQQALVNAARAQGLDRNPEVQARLRRAEEETLQQALISRAVAGEATEEKLRERYQRQVASRPAEEEVRARHILVPTEAEARAALEEVRRPGADFAEVARRRSTGPGSREGGELGWFKRGDMIPEFAEAAFGLRPNEVVQAPVRTQFGWHVIKVEDRRATPAPPFEEVRDSLRQQALEEAVGAAVERIRGAAQVERFNMDGTPARAPSLLEQAAPPAGPPAGPAPAQPRR
ncbi:MAG TPA: peptidylprolyl isomerase [Acetobacteraceae bacterium]|nr:peptidylprolyl isomerase [Acetobacteraceae bacterium]